MFSKSRASLAKPPATKTQATKAQEWTVNDFITKVLMLQPADISAEDMTLIKDRVNRYNVLIPTVGSDIIDKDESGLQELMDAINRGLARVSKYPNSYKVFGAVIGDDEIPEEDLIYLEKASIEYTYAFNNIGPEILSDYRDEDKLKKFNETLKQEAQRELSEQLHGEAEAKQDDAQPTARRLGCSIC